MRTSTVVGGTLLLFGLILLGLVEGFGALLSEETLLTGRIVAWVTIAVGGGGLIPASFAVLSVLLIRHMNKHPRHFRGGVYEPNRQLPVNSFAGTGAYDKLVDRGPLTRMQRGIIPRRFSDEDYDEHGNPTK